jgi:LEA14-like dessication related protein
MALRRDGIGMILWFLLLSLCSSACSFFQHIAGFVPTEPTIKVQKIHIEKLSLQAIELLVTVRVTNPNQFALELTNIRYRAAIDEQELAVGAYQSELIVSKLGSADVDLPLKIDVEKSLGVLKDVFIGGQARQLDISGTVTLVSSVHDWVIVFSESRTIGKQML